jgi:hypothetical protein
MDLGMNVRHHTEDGSGTTSRIATSAALRTVLAHPSLWAPSLAAAVRFAPTGWWHRRPFLPVPDERYWRFRMETAYGDETASVDADDLADVLRWAHRARVRRR